MPSTVMRACIAAGQMERRQENQNIGRPKVGSVTLDGHMNIGRWRGRGDRDLQWSWAPVQMAGQLSAAKAIERTTALRRLWKFPLQTCTF